MMLRNSLRVLINKISLRKWIYLIIAVYMFKVFMATLDYNGPFKSRSVDGEAHKSSLVSPKSAVFSHEVFEEEKDNVGDTILKGDAVDLEDSEDAESKLNINAHLLDVKSQSKLIADEKFFREREKVYKERQKQVKKVCNEAGISASYGSIYKTPLNRFRWLVARKLIMCFNAKVGTSTWTQYLLDVASPGILKNVSNWHYTAQKTLKPPFSRNSDDALALMNEFGKVMIVRHPFGRIMSAFRDKILPRTYGRLNKFLIKRYRPKSSNITTKVPTFEEFVRYIVEFTPLDDDIRMKREQHINRHWKHYYINCAPCDINYDVIAKMESIHEDTRYIIQKFKLGISDTVWNNHKSSKSSEETALLHFQKIPRDLTMKLYQRYKLDFLMFGYDVTNFLAPP